MLKASSGSDGAFLSWRSLLDIQFFPRQLPDQLLLRLPYLPDRYAPFANRFVALLAGGCLEHVGDGDYRLGFRRRQSRPLLAPLCKQHMHSLHLTSGESLFQIEIEADQSKDDTDGLGLIGCLLGCIRIYDVLMNE